jgi:hypothetical protein
MNDEMPLIQKAKSLDEEFYERSEVLRCRESLLQGMGHEVARRLQHPQAIRHLEQGFCRRALLLRENRFQANQIVKSSDGAPISCYQTSDLTIHLNSFYIHLRGAIDNLAWMIQYEIGLLPGVQEDRRASECNLFGKRFLGALRHSKPELILAIERKQTWEANLKRFRDPVAHRIPLSAVPAVANEEQATEIRRLHVLASEAYAANDFGRGMAYRHEATNVGQYIPCFVESNCDGLRLRHLPMQMAEDVQNFVELCEPILKTF